MKNLAFKTFLITLICFGGLYMLLVFSSRYNQICYHIIGIFLVIFSVFAFVMAASQKDKLANANQWGILSGLALWGFLGEYLEHLGWLDIAHWHYLPFLLILTFIIIFITVRRYLPARFGFSFGFFSGIWGLHMLMITQFEILGKTHWITYLSAGLFTIMAIFSYFRIRKTKTVNQKMVWALVLLLSSWTVLEYLWGWRVIPGPYSIH